MPPELQLEIDQVDLPLPVTDRREWAYALTPQPELPTPAPPAVSGLPGPAAVPAVESTTSPEGATSDAPR